MRIAKWKSRVFTMVGWLNMKIWLPNNSRSQIGGGWSFLRTFRKYAERAGVRIVDDWHGADGGLVSGVTLVEPEEVRRAVKSGIPIVFRVDNVPRKSRNRRNTPHERMKEIADLATIVVYQSKWAERYCNPLCGDGTVIYNGVDTDIFNTVGRPDNVPESWLFAYHGKNEMKGFWTAHLLFQFRARENPSAKFYFINDFGKDFSELQDANIDFWNDEDWFHFPKVDNPVLLADLMRRCTHLVHPAIADAAPQTVLEARACGLEIVGAAPSELAGTVELLDPNLDISAERMVSEYLAAFKLIHSNQFVG